MNLSCFQFSSLINTYTLSYICNNYDIYCDNYCLTDTLNKCYCFCDLDKIYCYEHTYYLQCFFSVLFFGLLVACMCYYFLICICKCFRGLKDNNRDYKYSIINNNVNNNVNNDLQINETLPKYEEIK
jgi:hypothetical protein